MTKRATITAAASAILLVLNAGEARAQTARVVPVRDSALLITAFPACTAPCADSARIEWRYGGQYVLRRVKYSAGADTTRVMRIKAGSAYTDSAVLMLTKFPLTNAPRRIVLAVPAIGAAATQTTADAPSPAAAKPAAPAKASAGGVTYAKPELPAVLSIPNPKTTGKTIRVGKDTLRP
jgi:hypothetical protein